VTFFQCRNAFSGPIRFSFDGGKTCDGVGANCNNINCPPTQAAHFPEDGSLAVRICPSIDVRYPSMLNALFVCLLSLVWYYDHLLLIHKYGVSTNKYSCWWPSPVSSVWEITRILHSQFVISSGSELGLESRYRVCAFNIVIILHVPYLTRTIAYNPAFVLPLSQS